MPIGMRRGMPGRAAPVAGSERTSARFSSSSTKYGPSVSWGVPTQVSELVVAVALAAAPVADALATVAGDDPPAAVPAAVGDPLPAAGVSSLSPQALSAGTTNGSGNAIPRI